MLTDHEVALLVAVVTAVGVGLPAVLAWLTARKNATQESVDTLHDCLNKHTEQDEANFATLHTNQEKIGKQIAALKKQVDRRTQTIVDSQADAADLAVVVKQTLEGK